MRIVSFLFLAVSILCFPPTTTTEAPLFYPGVGCGVGEYPIFVAIGDLDGDGNPDLAMANWVSDNVSVLLGNGDGTFQDGRELRGR